jgi:diphthine-ammonia ligase
MKNVIATWSGGKDSCFAAYKATQQGYNLTHIANTVSNDYRRVRFHGLKAEFIQAQAQAIGIPLLQQETSPERYEAEFKSNLCRGLSDDTHGVVFGDIHLDDCLAWAKKVSADLGVEAIEPLWHMPQEQILSEFIEAGFQAMIVSTQADILGKEWIGRIIDRSFLEDIGRLPNVDACGENGEYHSAVINGPLFERHIEITKAEPVLIGNYWFYDIQEFRLADAAMSPIASTSS